MTRRSLPTNRKKNPVHYQQDEAHDPREPEPTRSASAQLQKELDTAINAHENDERERIAVDASRESERHLEKHVMLLEDHISRLVDNVLDMSKKTESLHQALADQIARDHRRSTRPDRFPVLSHLVSTALDGDERNLLRKDLDEVIIHVAISVCADAELRRLLCRFDIEVPAKDCLTFMNYQQAVAAIADDMESKAQSVGVDDEHRDHHMSAGPGIAGCFPHLLQLRDTLSSESDDSFLVPRLICLDFSRSAIVPSFFDFSLCSPNAAAFYSMWLARNILFGTRMAYHSEIYFQRANETSKLE